MPPTEAEAMKLAADLCRPWIHTTLCELIAAASYKEDDGLGQPCTLEDVAVLVLTQRHTGDKHYGFSSLVRHRRIMTVGL